MKKIDLLLCVYILVSFWVDKDTFIFSKPSSLLLYVISKSIFVLLILYVRFLFVHRKLLKIIEVEFFALYFFGFSIGLLILWPGNWVEVDEFSIYANALYLLPDMNQGLFISVVHIVGLMIYPNPGFIIVLQIFFAASVYSKVTSYFWEKRKSHALLLLIVFFSPPALYYLYQPMRGFWFSLLLLMLFFFYYRAFRENRYNRTEVAFMSLIVALIINIRMESKIFILIFPIMIILLNNKFSLNRFKYVLQVVAFLFISLICYVAIENYNGAKNSPIWIEFDLPIREILYDDNIDKELIKKELIDVDRVIPLEMIKNKSTELIPFSVPRDDFSKLQYHDFIDSALRLCLKYPKSYLVSRYRPMMASIGLGDWEFIQTADLPQTWKKGSVPKEMMAKHMHAQTSLSKFLGGQFEINGVKMYPYFWALWIPIFCMFLVFMTCLLQRDFERVILPLVAIVYTFVVYFTAPGLYAFYYFPSYILGYFLVIANLNYCGGDYILKK